MTRAHTGRRRNEEARKATLAATFEAIRRDGVSGLRIESIAREAGVSKQTIYRWWPRRAALVVDAASERSHAEVAVRDTGSVAGDVEAFLDATYRAARLPDMTPVLRALLVEAQAGGEAAEALDSFTGGRRELLAGILQRGIDRRELPADTDLELLCDIGFGVLWYRLLVGHARVDDTLARRVTAAIVPR